MSDFFRRAALALLVCCAAGHADPFAPAASAPVPASADTAEAPPPSPGPSPDYQVVGVAILGARAVAVARTPQGRLQVVRPGERLGDATVAGITLDGVDLKTADGVSRLPVGD